MAAINGLSTFSWMGVQNSLFRSLMAWPFRTTTSSREGMTTIN
jgi:hypothetical protein